MALTYTVETSSKFALFYDESTNQGADPEELLEKAKRESEQQRIAKEQAKRKEKEESKKTKGNTESAPQTVPQTTPQQSKEGNRKENSQTKKPWLNKPRPADQPPRNKSANKPHQENREQQDFHAADVDNAHLAEQASSRPSTSDRPFRGRRGFRGGRGFYRGSFQRSNNDAPEERIEGTVESGREPFADPFERPPPRGGGYRGRGGRSRGMRFNSGPHVFDRHSGSRNSGVKPIEKKNGAGPHNWGNDVEEAQHALQRDHPNPNGEAHENLNETVTHGGPDANVDTTAESGESGQAPELEQETAPADSTEPQELTVAEYFAKSDADRQRLQNMQQAIQKKKSNKKVNMTGKTEDFAGMVPYVKKNEGEDAELVEGGDSTEDQKRKHTLDIPAFRRQGNVPSATGGRSFRPPRDSGFSGGRGSGGYRGSGGGRGRGGSAEYRGSRGGGRGFHGGSHRQDGVHLRLDSDVDFPTLGAD